MDSAVQDRRAEELEALQAYYGNDLLPSLRARPPEDGTADVPPLAGPWFVRIRPATVDDGGTGGGASLGTPTLELRLPPSYPLGDESPTPRLHHIMMRPELQRRLLDELHDMYEAETDVGLLWTERCREELRHGDMAGVDAGDGEGAAEAEGATDAATADDGDGGEAVRTFLPPTTRYHQPTRHFPAEVIADARYRREITRTPPFHPPRSGPSEIMIAHVCTVTCMEHVQWALADLLFNDKKVAKATHNMFAYRFAGAGAGTAVSDNDDDGEKGSGRKLAALLELSGADDVLVVVSRWYGGSLLGPARFKWIAGVAREGLVRGGFLAR